MSQEPDSASTPIIDATWKSHVHGDDDENVTQEEPTIQQQEQQEVVEVVQPFNNVDYHPGACCRYCLGDTCDEDTGEMISPCNCTGSIQYVHRGCLDKWRTLSINPAAFHKCEVCNEPYQFEEIDKYKPGAWNWIKYILTIAFDVLLIFAVWQLGVLLFAFISYLADTQHNRMELFLFSYWANNNFTKFLSLYVLGLILFFCFLGLVAIFIIGISLIFRCQKTQSEDFHYYSRYSSIRYSWFDLFLCWYLCHIGFCDCSSLYLFHPCENCLVGIFRPGGGGGGGGYQRRPQGGLGGGSGETESVLVLLGIVLIIVLMLIGIVFGGVLVAFLMYHIIKRRTLILYRVDRAKYLRVKNLE